MHSLNSYCSPLNADLSDWHARQCFGVLNRSYGSSTTARHHQSYLSSSYAARSSSEHLRHHLGSNSWSMKHLDAHFHWLWQVPIRRLGLPLLSSGCQRYQTAQACCSSCVPSFLAQGHSCYEGAMSPASLWCGFVSILHLLSNFPLSSNLR